MIETLIRTRLVVPPIKATEPSEIEVFGRWHWGTHKLDRLRGVNRLNVMEVARNIIDHGSLFAFFLSGSNSLSLVTTAPSDDVALVHPPPPQSP